MCESHCAIGTHTHCVHVRLCACGHHDVHACVRVCAHKCVCACTLTLASSRVRPCSLITASTRKGRFTFSVHRYLYVRKCTCSECMSTRSMHACSVHMPHAMCACICVCTCARNACGAWTCSRMCMSALHEGELAIGRDEAHGAVRVELAKLDAPFIPQIYRNSTFPLHQLLWNDDCLRNCLPKNSRMPRSQHFVSLRFVYNHEHITITVNIIMAS